MTTLPDVHIGANLRQLREDKLLTQQDVADVAGIGLSSIVRIENDHTEPRFSTIRKIAAALGVEPRELTGRG
jgi:transcriptional regulator with XRE-family HTH domain